MNSKMAFRFLQLTAIVLLTYTDYAYPQGEFTETMLFKDTDEVVTAGRIEQSVNQAPATMTVITSQEIRAMGATSIPEILRYVPGLEVMTITASHAEVGIRGLTQVPSNNVLVMIDGRTVYFDYYGGVVWESLPILIEQIDRIEVMRSPGSALYGANAFTGVINILTKTPNQITDQQVFIQAGEYTDYYGGVILGGVKGNTGYRFAGGAKRINSFADSGEDSGDMVLGNLLIEQQILQDTKLSLDAGVSNGFVHKIFLGDINKARTTTTYTKLELSSVNYYIRAFWNRVDQRENTFYGPSNKESIFANTYDIEAQGQNRLWPGNTLVYGASYRLNTIRSNILDESHEHHLSAVFIQDEYKVIPEVTLSAGMRLDRHPLVGTNISPRANVGYSPNTSNFIRITYGRAFRNPTHLNFYLDYLAPRAIYFDGNEDLSSEKISSYELAYVFAPGSDFRFELDLFGEHLEDHIFLDPTGFFDPMNFTTTKTYSNRGRATVLGGEIMVEMIPIPNLKLAANYTNQHIRNRFSIDSTQTPPKSKANFSAHFSSRTGFNAFLGISYIGSSQWSIPNPLGLYEEERVDSHTRVDAKLGYKFTAPSQFEVFLKVYNLLDNGKVEYPNAEKVQRTIVAGGSVYF